MREPGSIYAACAPAIRAHTTRGSWCISDIPAAGILFFASMGTTRLESRTLDIVEMCPRETKGGSRHLKGGNHVHNQRSGSCCN
jgi:hypothetical protein